MAVMAVDTADTGEDTVLVEEGWCLALLQARLVQWLLWELWMVGDLVTEVDLWTAADLVMEVDLVMEADLVTEADLVETAAECLTDEEREGPLLTYFYTVPLLYCNLVNIFCCTENETQSHKGIKLTVLNFHFSIRNSNMSNTKR
jgi:hypothetical protein